MPSGETLSFEGASTRSCVSRKVLLTTGLGNMPRSELAWTGNAPDGENDVMGQQRPLAKFNYHVGEGEQRRRQFEAERVGGFEV